MGEPGVGKSRLSYEFVERSRARGVAVYQAHGLAHGKAIPFLPLLEILREYFASPSRRSLHLRLSEKNPKAVIL